MISDVETTDRSSKEIKQRSFEVLSRHLYERVNQYLTFVKVTIPLQVFLVFYIIFAETESLRFALGVER